MAGSKGSGKSSLIFTLTRGLFPGNLVPGRFEGLSLAATATPKDAASNEAKNKAANKPYFVNLTFWEDRPRLNLWEKSLQQQRQLEKEKKEQEAKKVTTFVNEVTSHLSGGWLAQWPFVINQQHNVLHNGLVFCPFPARRQNELKMAKN